MSMRQRILRGFAANGFGQAVTVGAQLLLLPILLHAWGAPAYADWVLLSAIPAYVGMMDGGLGAVAGNQMTLDKAAGRNDRVHAVANAAFRWLSLILGGALLVGAVAIWFIPWGAVLNLGPTAPIKAALVALALAASTILGLWMGIMAGILRAEERYASGVMLGNMGRLAEAVACGATAWLGGGLVAAALAMVAVKFMAAAMTLVMCRVWVGWLPDPRRGAWADIRPLLPAAAAQVAMPFSYAMSLQGVVIAIAHAAGAEAAAAFNAMRVLTRVVAQATTLMGNSVGPELTRLVGAGNSDAALRLLLRTTGVAMIIAFVGVVGLALFGPAFFQIWTGGKLVFMQSVWWWLLAVVLLYCLWNTLSYLPVSINRHVRISMIFTIAALFSPLIMFGLAVTGGVSYGTAGLVGIEFALVIVVVLWLSDWRKEVLKERLISQKETTACAFR